MLISTLFVIALCFSGNIIYSIDNNHDLNEQYIDVNTTSGLVRGHTIQVVDHNVNEFLGIPFAVPPVGPLRFAKPEPIQLPLKDIINATVTGKSCVQQPYPFGSRLIISEDCLMLNVWSPPLLASGLDNKQLKPVMVWFYGGAFVLGSIFQLPNYNGSVLATNDVVIVTVNYRVGPFGFLYADHQSAPGNVGLYDQQMALKWIQQNIDQFGGDPDMVILFGESAGSWSVSAHITSPLSRGLFRRAIMESAAQLWNKKRPMNTKAEALEETRQLANHFNCTSSTTELTLQCLRKVDPIAILDFKVSTNNTYHANIVYGTDIMPVNAQVAFANHDFAKDIDLMAGVTALEGSALSYYFFPILMTKNITKQDFHDLVVQNEPTFHTENVDNIVNYYLKDIDLDNSTAIRQAFFEFYGDVLITCPTYMFAKLFALNTGTGNDGTGNSHTFFYQWNYGSSMGAIDEIMGVTHGADLRYVFGLPLTQHDVNYTKVDQQFAVNTMKLWTNFAKYGKPDTLDKWPKFVDKSVNQSLIIKVKDMDPLNDVILKNNPFHETCDQFWKDYYL